jgi:hypothetical protein
MKKHWVIVVSREHARRGVQGGFIMANHGKRAPLQRMRPGDTILVYSPRDAFPDGEPLKAVTFVGEVTGEAPEPSEVIPGGWRLAATRREIEPIPLADVKQHVPASRIRFGCYELPATDAEAVLALSRSG